MKAVIFDVDGTLVDSVDLHAKAWQEALERFGHRVPFEQVRAQIGKGGDQLMPVFLSKTELEEKGEELERYRSELFKRRYLKEVKGFPMVRPLFERLLSDGWRLALASSAKGDELQTYKDRAQIGDLLDAETSSDDAEKSKPHPDIFQAALARLKLPASECVVVGDSPYDAQAATKAAISSVGFLCGGFSRANLEAVGFREIYEGPAHLLEDYTRSLLHAERPHATV